MKWNLSIFALQCELNWGGLLQCIVEFLLTRKKSKKWLGLSVVFFFLFLIPYRKRTYVSWFQQGGVRRRWRPAGKVGTATQSHLSVIRWRVSFSAGCTSAAGQCAASSRNSVSFRRLRRGRFVIGRVVDFFFAHSFLCFVSLVSCELVEMLADIQWNFLYIYIYLFIYIYLYFYSLFRCYSYWKQRRGRRFSAPPSSIRRWRWGVFENQ